MEAINTEPSNPLTSTTAGPNDEYRDVWEGILADKYERYRAPLQVAMDPHNWAAMEASGPRPGQRVLDVGCGYGDSTFDLAARVGQAGHVVGLDVCQPFIDVGRRDAEAAGINHIDWLAADAQTHPFDAAFDLWFARFGTMFFASPVAALRNLRRALVPGGRAMMLVWTRKIENPWLALAEQVVRPMLPPPDQGPVCGPGPFSMSDAETVTAMMRAAGYARVKLTRVSTEVILTRGLAETVRFQLAIGPAGEMMRLGGELAEQRRPEIEAAVADALRPYLVDEGVKVRSSAWRVEGINPS